MLTFRRPDEDAIARFIASQQNAPLSYATEGMTRGDSAPAEFHRDHFRVQLGEGPDVFERAVAALRKWTMFQQGWVELRGDGRPPTVGQVVAIVPKIGPVWWLNACRVLYLIDEESPRRVGFTYGTLQEHAECGEERFMVEMTADGAVWYDLYAFSHPRHWLARLGGPFTRAQQRRFAKGSAAAMRRAIVGEGN